jgi:hypothetical protein
MGIAPPEAEGIAARDYFNDSSGCIPGYYPQIDI